MLRRAQVEGQPGCVLDRGCNRGRHSPVQGEVNCRQEPGGPRGVDMYHQGKETQVLETWSEEVTALGDWLRKEVGPGGGGWRRRRMEGDGVAFK